MALLNIFIATSLDGFIAKTDGDIGWLSMVEREGEDYGYAEFISEMDTIMIGRKTYDKVLTLSNTFPYGGRKTYVITRTKTGSNENVEFFGGELKPFVTKLKSRPGKGIYCDGGAELIDALIKDDMIDRYIISTLPVLLGSGIPLFKEGRPQQQLTLKSSRSFPSGLVQNEYLKP